MSGGYGLVVRFHLTASGAEEFDRLVAETVPEIAKYEPGTLVYTVHEVAGQPDERVFYELYADQAAFEAHEQQPHTLRFLAERDRYLTGYEVDFLTPIASSKGV